MAAPQDLSLSDQIALGGLIVAVFAVVISVVAMWAHGAVRDQTARATLIERLQSRRARQLYHALLRAALGWLDDRIGPPPLARRNPAGRRHFGIKSLGVCVTLSMVYSFLFFFVGWVGGGPSALGEVRLFDLWWAPAWAPPWLPRLLVALLICAIAAFFFWYLPAAGRPAPKSAGDTVFSVVLFLGAGAVAGAVAGVVALAVVALAVAGAAEPALIWLLFFAALPLLNGLLDWISLSVSRWFGRGIVAEEASPAAVLVTLALVLGDLLAAVAFLFAIAWLLPWGVETLARSLGFDLDLTSYLETAVAHPWSSGLWASVMVLSTLIPTAIHLALALGAIGLSLWPIRLATRWAAGQLATGNEAHFLGPQLYLTFAWLVPLVLAPLALIWLVAQVVGLAEPLPQLLLATGLNGIETARSLFP